MNFQVIYFSRKKSTKKIADVIASELDVKAEDVKDVKLNEKDLVFLGSGSYGSKPGKDMKKFIEKNDFKNKDVALFGTSGGGTGEEVKAMEDMLNKKGANVKGKRGKICLWNTRRAFITIYR
ncbi:MAG: flavodoxin domain-containing protein [Bacteroidales bacterium]